jgi:hypothetical protein
MAQGRTLRRRPGLGGAYQVYRATTPGGPYTQANNRPVVAGVFFDDGSGQDLAPSTTYYYTVRHLDSHWQQSPASNEIAVETTASDGDWGISVAPHGTASPNVRTPTAIMFARNKLTNIFANAAAMGPTSSASTVTANATCSATWSATWSGNSFTSKPGMYVLDEVKSRSADVAISSAGDTAVATSGGATLLSAQNPVGLTSYSTLPIITDTVDSSDPGHYVFRIDRRTDERKVGVDARGGGLTERVNDTTHIIHVFTPAYFDAHFTDPKLIKMSMIIPQTDVDATVTLHAGAPAGATAEAAGTVSDEYRNYDERL